MFFKNFTVLFIIGILFLYNYRNLIKKFKKKIVITFENMEKIKMTTKFDLYSFVITRLSSYKKE